MVTMETTFLVLVIEQQKNYYIFYIWFFPRSYFEKKD